MKPSIYGCHNSAQRDPAATYPVQDGWRYFTSFETGRLVREPVIIEHVNPMSIGCQYTIRSPDPHCAGCRQAAR